MSTATANNMSTTVPTIEARPAPEVDLAAAQEAIDSGEYDLAVDRLEAIIAETPDSAEAYNRLGYVHRRLQNFAEAFVNYGRTLALDPDHTGAHHYIGEAYLEIDDLDKAEHHLARLNDICEWGCDDFWQLKAAVELYRANVL
jgi:tetratricopeptide (TPR) repeat protein